MTNEQRYDRQYAMLTGPGEYDKILCAANRRGQTCPVLDICAVSPYHPTWLWRRFTWLAPHKTKRAYLNQGRKSNEREIRRNQWV
jgi:hypothetical protein